MRDNVDRKTAIARLNIQTNDQFYIDKVDYIIKNNGMNLEEQIEELAKTI